MSHMPSFSNPGQVPSGQATLINVVYTITGLETNGGLDFMVPIGGALGDLNYGVYPANNGVASTPLGLDLPNALSTDRTVTAFRVLLPAPQTVGDKLAFLIVGF